jgi:hypothetical protein
MLQGRLSMIWSTGVLDPIKPRRIVCLDQQGRWDGPTVREGNFATYREAVRQPRHPDDSGAVIPGDALSAVREHRRRQAGSQA